MSIKSGSNTDNIAEITPVCFFRHLSEIQIDNVGENTALKQLKAHSSQVVEDEK
jgi:hypothetical protein